MSPFFAPFFAPVPKIAASRFSVPCDAAVPSGPAGNRARAAGEPPGKVTGGAGPRGIVHGLASIALDPAPGGVLRSVQLSVLLSLGEASALVDRLVGAAEVGVLGSTPGKNGRARG